MEITTIKQVFERTHPLRGIAQPVEVRYINEHGNIEIKPGYIGRIVDFEIPAEYKDVYKTEPPFIELCTCLDRNAVPVNSLEIRTEDIRDIRILRRGEVFS